MKKNISRVNKACKYFPCHIELEDCAFCYCPLYPCGNNIRGEFIFTKDKRKIWSCQNCNWIHKKSAVDEIFELIRARYKPVKIAKNNDSARTGVIILSHGSRLKNANLVMTNTVNTVKKELSIKNVLSAYMQFHQPDLTKTVRRLAAKGCKKIIIVPFFLFKGNHVSMDVPKAIDDEKTKYPQIKFIYTRNLGPDTRLCEIVIERIREALKCSQKT